MNNNDADNLWSEISDSEWNQIPSLGKKWIGKWTHSENGYSLILYDGVDHWGEQRDASYVKEKAEEWAACLESEVQELSDLVLSQLEEKNSQLQLVTDDNHHKIRVELTASLDQLPYNWLFYLSKLSSSVIEHHWTIPVATTIELLSARINQLEEELKRKNSQLEEFLPPKSIITKDKDVVLTKCMETAAQNIVSKGIGNTFCSHLNCAPAVIQMIKDRESNFGSKSENTKLSAALPHNRPRQKTRKLQKGAICEEIIPSNDEKSEMERRAEIRSLTQGPGSVTVPKKKKKLKI